MSNLVLVELDWSHNNFFYFELIINQDFEQFFSTVLENMDQNENINF